MKKNILTIVIAFTLIAISGTSFAEERGACYIQCVYVEQPKSIQKKCTDNLTRGECQKAVNDLNQSIERGSDRYGPFKGISLFVGRWERNQACTN